MPTSLACIFKHNEDSKEIENTIYLNKSITATAVCLDLSQELVIVSVMKLN